MKTNLKKCAALAVVLGIGAFSASTGAMAMQDNCTRYALQSAKQQQINLAKKCGFKGDEWTKNIRQLKTWCNSVSSDEWNSRLKKRAQALSGCK